MSSSINREPMVKSTAARGSFSSSSPQDSSILMSTVFNRIETEQREQNGIGVRGVSCIYNRRLQVIDTDLEFWSDDLAVANTPANTLCSEPKH